jgi:hypothetical protein
MLDYLHPKRHTHLYVCPLHTDKVFMEHMESESRRQMLMGESPSGGIPCYKKWRASCRACQHEPGYVYPEDPVPPSIPYRETEECHKLTMKLISGGFLPRNQTSTFPIIFALMCLIGMIAICCIH